MCFVYSREWGHVCETNVCFLSENRKRFICEVFSQFWCECFRNFSNLFSSPAYCCLHSPGDKTKSGCSCGITTNPVKSDERSKLETTQEVKRDKNLKYSSSRSNWNSNSFLQLNQTLKSYHSNREESHSVDISLTVWLTTPHSPSLTDINSNFYWGKARVADWDVFLCKS